jgi:FixJ family two-component response regulator
MSQNHPGFRARNVRDRLVLAIVDDDGDVRRALVRMLRADGHEVQLFASAEDYLGQQCCPDCLILDLQLPGISGLELEGKLRQAGSRLPIVFISAHDDPVTREAVRRTRMPYLRKPFDQDALLDAIASATRPAG